MLHARMWAGPSVPTVARRKPPAGTPPDWEFDFPYGYAHGFEAQTTTVAVTIPDGLLNRRSNVHIYTEVMQISANGNYEHAQAIASAKGEFVQYTKPPALVPKYSLLSGEVRKGPCTATLAPLRLYRTLHVIGKRVMLIRSVKNTLKRHTVNEDRWRVAFRNYRSGCEATVMCFLFSYRHCPVPRNSLDTELN